ncbi:MAG: membrane protein insertion efficiency factor YidD [Methylocystis sp.]|nr:membrane protein insertion efficiency factor YidD [Methylocystis sp.]MBI3275327.1 membrane protein insertion efficiency factor YidD [Methylocystis sp.]
MTRSISAALARALIFLYRVSFSALIGRQCRHVPSCSEYADEAIARYGLWAGGWVGAARLYRCRPGGTAGFDPVPQSLPDGAGPLTPWRYGVWRGPLACDAAPLAAAPAKGQDRAISSTARP